MVPIFCLASQPLLSPRQVLGCPRWRHHGRGEAIHPAGNSRRVSGRYPHWTHESCFNPRKILEFQRFCWFQIVWKQLLEMILAMTFISWYGSFFFKGAQIFSRAGKFDWSESESYPDSYPKKSWQKHDYRCLIWDCLGLLWWFNLFCLHVARRVALQPFWDVSVLVGSALRSRHQTPQAQVAVRPCSFSQGARSCRPRRQHRRHWHREVERDRLWALSHGQSEASARSSRRCLQIAEAQPGLHPNSQGDSCKLHQRRWRGQQRRFLEVEEELRVLAILPSNKWSPTPKDEDLPGCEWRNARRDLLDFVGIFLCQTPSKTTMNKLIVPSGVAVSFQRFSMLR